MNDQIKQPETRGTSTTVILRYLRIAPRKVRLVAGLIRGLSVNEAEAQLMHSPRRPAKPILKLLRSGVAAVKDAKKMNPDNLFVSAIRIDQGPMLKRQMPRAQGSSSMIQKKMSHVVLTLEEATTANQARFKIIAPKKIRLTADQVKQLVKERDKKKALEASSRPSTDVPGKKKGFLKKVFNRRTPSAQGE